MEFNRAPSSSASARRLIKKDLVVGLENDIASLAKNYPFALQFFKYPPIDDALSLQELEKFVLDRLKALRIIEMTRKKHNVNTNVYRETLFKAMKKENLWPFFKKTPIDDEDTILADYQDRRIDHVSHFVLRLAYCKTEEMRLWFLKQEVDLFAVRFHSEHRSVIKRWLEYHDFNFEPISPEERERLRPFIITNQKHWVSDSTEFFKVPFTDVLELVSKRLVHVEDGFAYIKLKDLSVIVTANFRAKLSEALVMTARSVAEIDDSRLNPLLRSLNSRHVGRDPSGSRSGETNRVIYRGQLDTLSSKSFPLCMRQLHTALRQNHHLKHYGRHQYLLFLKGIGMTLEEVLQFWREEFTKIMDSNMFDKQYSYQVRHSFGKEGKRVDYTPYSCLKIIMKSNPSIGDHHGCPFRHTDSSLLKQRLQSFKISSASIKDIMDFVSDGHYQLACTRYFDVTHGGQLKQGISHPNQYFDESYKLSHGGGQLPTIITKPVINLMPSLQADTGSRSATGSVTQVPDDDGIDEIMANMG